MDDFDSDMLGFVVSLIGMAVCVVGAGVIGLSSALEILRAGHNVVVIADRFSPDTTSDGERICE